MKVHFLTIVLDGMPWIPVQFAMLNGLKCDWHWHVVEGVAKPVNCTRWCQRIMPRLSVDGTTEFVDALKSHPRISVYQQPEWEGKIQMCNTPLDSAKGDGLLWQLDVDEIWTREQVSTTLQMFEDQPDKSHAQFKCRYFVGPNIVITSENCYGNRYDIEWYRVWRWSEGQRFISHEPPRLDGTGASKFSVSETSERGLVFDHYAYATREQVAFKESYYAYKNAVASWKRLQDNETWPVKLRDYLPWVTDAAIADKLWKNQCS